MSASEHLSPDQLHRIAQRFYEENFSKHKLEVPHHAIDMCDTCTDAFLKHHNISGARGQWYEGENKKGLYVAHKVAHVPTTRGMHIVDMTYNQFVHDPEATGEHESVEIPLVEPLDAYLQRPLMSRLSPDPQD